MSRARLSFQRKLLPNVEKNDIWKKENNYFMKNLSKRERVSLFAQVASIVIMVLAMFNIYHDEIRVVIEVLAALVVLDSFFGLKKIQKENFEKRYYEANIWAYAGIFLIFCSAHWSQEIEIFIGSAGIVACLIGNIKMIKYIKLLSV